MRKNIARKLAMLLALVVLVTTFGSDYNSIGVHATSEDDIEQDANYDSLFTENIGDEQNNDAEETAQVEEPVAEEPVQEEPVQEAVQEEPVQEEPAQVEEPVAEEPVQVEEPAQVEEPVAEEQPAQVEEPAAEASAQVETPAEEQVTEEPQAEAVQETPEEPVAEEVTPATEEQPAETVEEVKEDKAVNEVTVTYAATEGGKVDKTSETIDINAESAAFEGATATAIDDTYKFVNWTDKDGNEVSTEDKFVPSNIVEDVTFTANFVAAAETTEAEETKEAKEVTVKYVASKGGKVDKTSETIDINAEDAKFEGATATPWSEKYEFVNWTDAEGNEVSTEDKFVPSDIEEDATFTANFAIPDNMPELSVEDVHEGGMIVSVKAEAGIFPEGTEVRITAISDDQALSTAQDKLGEEVTTAKGVDITFFYKGEEIQPADQKYVHVTLAFEEAMDVEDVTVLHDHNNDVDTIGNADVSKNAEGEIESVEFNSNEFSIYIVAGENGEDNRLCVKFVNDDKEIASMLVKKSDADKESTYKTVLYDPGVGTINDSETFKGWTLDKDYTRESVSYSIDEVREYVKKKLPPTKDNDESETVTFYAMFLKQYRVNYLDTFNVSLGEHFVDISANAKDGALEREYEVNMAYTPVDEHHDFQGWNVESGADNIVKKNGADYDYNTATDEEKIFVNGTTITITGDVTFSVNAPEGHWLIFEKNGNGATYVAPQFIYKDDKDPAKTKPSRPNDADMLRNGYKFGGWYEAEYETDANGKQTAKKDENGNVILQTTEFDFDQKLEKNTTIYAKWDPNDTAPYTILIYKENVNGNLEFADSYRGIGKVDDTLTIKKQAIQVLNKNQMNYVKLGTVYDVDENGNSKQKEYGGIESVPASQTTIDPFTGFTFDDTKTEDEKITPEGDATCKIVFKPMEYIFKFYVAKDGANGNYKGAIKEDELTSGNWSANLGTTMTTLTGFSTLQKDSIGYYYTFEDDQGNPVTVKYGQDISGKWPSQDKVSHNKFASWILMSSARSYIPTPAGEKKKGRNTVKGIVGVMDEHILGDLTRTDANYVTARYELQTIHQWVYEIWLKPDANSEPKLDHIVEATSAQTGDGSQHNPPIEGYEVIGSETKYLGQIPEKYGNKWVMKYVYKPLEYPLNYMDGAYVNSNNDPLPNVGHSHQIKAEKVAYRGSLKDDKYYFEPTATQDGFVFEGWYKDAGCTNKFEWKDEATGKKYLGENANTVMSTSGITVYAKWRRVEYRVFLHPFQENVKNPGTITKDTDPGLTWGKSEESDTEPEMNFKVPYGGKVSEPHGTGRPGWEFVGWFKNPECTEPFNASAYALNNDNTVPYDKNDPKNYTDTMDIWGNGATYNKDADKTETNPGGQSRFWVKRKLDIYGKWRKVVEGADGIDVVYSPIDPDIDGNKNPGGAGIEVPVDNKQYVDDADAYAMPASKAPEGYEFGYWVMQKWNGSAYEDAKDKNGKIIAINPGTSYKVLVDNARRESKVDANDNQLYDLEGNPQYTYTVQLRAEYVKPDESTPTYIPWFENDGTEAFHIDKLENGKNTLGINEGVDIQGIPAGAEDKEDYEFVGWARVTMGTSEAEAKAFMSDSSKFTQNVNPDDPGFLYYNAEDGKFYADAAFSKEAEAKQVAADEAMPYQALFAVWRKIDFLEVYITGNNTEVPYNGKEQSVTGYTIDSIMFKGQELKGTGIESTISLVTPGSDKASGTDVKRNAEKGEIESYPMNLYGTPKQGDDFTCSFKCTSNDFPNVKFFVTDGFIKITPLKLKVTVIGNRGEEYYDGTEKKVTGYTLNDVSEVEPGQAVSDGQAKTSAKDLYEESKVTFTGEAVAKGIYPNTYPMNLTADQFGYNDSNIEVTFEVIDGQLLIKDRPEGNKLHVIAKTPDRTEMYSGKTWVGTDFDYTVEGKVASTNALAKALNALGSVFGIDANAADGGKEVTINDIKYYVSGLRVDVSARDVGQYKLSIVNDGFKVSDASGTDVTKQFDDPEYIIGTFTITPKPIELTSASAEKFYDGEALVMHEASANTAWGEGDAITYNFTGSQKEVGTSKNLFEAVPANDLTKFSNYTITYIYGDLTVKEKTDTDTPDEDDDVPDDDDPKDPDDHDGVPDKDKDHYDHHNDNGGDPDGGKVTPKKDGDVLGAKRNPEQPGVLGARRGGTEDTTNTSRVIVLIIAAGAVATLLVTGKKRKKNEE